MLSKLGAGLALATGLMLIHSGRSMAQDSPSPSQEQSRQFSIPAGPLTPALNRFAAQSGLQILFDASLANGRATPGVSGAKTPNQALTALLSGTGVVFRYTGQGTVTLDGPASNAAGATVEGAIALDTIDVSGGGEAEAAADLPYQTPGSSSYISAEQIDRFPGSTSGDIFKSTPGVIASGNHSGGASMDVNIRGMQGQSRVKVSVDGTQQSATTWRGYIGVDERVYVDPDMIGGASIDKGPSGGADGAGTTGGVVAIRTLNAQDLIEDGKTFGARYRIGTSDNAIDPPAGNTYSQRNDAPSLFDFENGSGSIAAATTTENVDVVAAFARRKTGNYFAGKNGDTELSDGRSLSLTKPGEEAFNTSEDSLSGLAKSTIRLGDGQSLDFGYMHYESKFGEAMGSLLFNYEPNWHQIKLSSADVDTYTGRYRWNPNDDIFDVRFNVWATHIDQVTRLAQAVPDLSKWGLIAADDPRYSETWTYGTDLSNTSRIATPFGGLKLDYGASYLIENMDGETFCSRPYTRDRCVWLTPSIGTREIGSVFSQAEWVVNDWLKFNGELRYDAFRLEDKGESAVPGKEERDGGRLNPSASITVTPFNGFQLFAQYAEGVRPPTMRETMGSDANSIPNPDLEPEVAKNWEFGANYLKSGVLDGSDKLRLKASYFINNYEDYISRVPSNAGGGEFVFTFHNLETAKFEGIEVSGGYDAGIFFSEAALTYYTDFEFCRTASTCAQNAVMYDYATNHLPPELNVSVTLGVRLFDEKLILGGRAIHNGERLTRTVGHSSDLQRTAMWLPYTVFDAFATYKMTEQLTLDVRAENLTDRYYVDALDGWMAAPGRTIRTELTARF